MPHDPDRKAEELLIVPLYHRQANAFVKRYHRHSKPLLTARFSVGCKTPDGKLVGAAMCARPAARHLDDGTTLEVARLATDGTKNVCSALYQTCARIATEMGYAKIQSYILHSEPGWSLKTSGWTLEKTGTGGTPQGMRKNRPRGHAITPITFEKKQRWARLLNPKVHRIWAKVPRWEVISVADLDEWSFTSKHLPYSKPGVIRVDEPASIDTRPIMLAGVGRVRVKRKPRVAGIIRGGGTMDKAVQVLQEQLQEARKRVSGLEGAIRLLQGSGAAAKASKSGGKRVISAAGRKAMAAAAKRMWRAKKAKSHKAKAPKAAAPAQ